MIFGGTPHVSPLAVPALRERAVKIGSAGKIFSLTGWKVGWAVAAPPLAEAIAAQHQFLTFTTPTPLQWAVAEGLALPAEWHAAHRAQYEAARARLVDGLTERRLHAAPGRRHLVRHRSTSPPPGSQPDDEAVAERLMREAGRGLDPGLGVLHRGAREGLPAAMLRQAGCDARRGDRAVGRNSGDRA